MGRCLRSVDKEYYPPVTFSVVEERAGSVADAHDGLEETTTGAGHLPQLLPVAGSDTLVGMVAAGLAIAIGVILVDIWIGGPLQSIDLWLAQWKIEKTSILHRPASLVDHIGLRGLTAPILALTGAWLSRRTGQWRPFKATLVSIALLNLVVGTMKIVVGRGSPSDGVPELFVGDMMWPSGHSGNIAMTTALMIYLLRSYGGYSFSRRLAAAIVIIPCSMMAIVSVALGYHWFSDLLAGTLVGLYVALAVARWDLHHQRRAFALGAAGSMKSPRDRQAITGS